MTPLDILRAHEPGQWTRPEDCASRTPLPIDEGDRVGVVLFNLGGPSTLGEVEPFLYRLLMDPLLLDVPVGGRMRRWLARSVAYLRAGTLREHYELIGGASPVPRLAREQATVLQDHLDARYGGPAGVGVRVYSAMRYGRPFPEKVAADMEADGVDKVVLVPSYPQYAAGTTGSALAYWKALGARGERPSWPTTVVPEYAANPKYVQAVSERIDEALQRFPRHVREEVALVFSAHGSVFNAQGPRKPPYCCHVHSTVDRVMQHRGRDRPFRTAFQSLIGPNHWLTPSTLDTMAALAEQGHRAVLVVPIAFVTDHVNVRYDLDVDVRETASAHGIDYFEVTAGLNTHPLFIEALGEATMAQLDVPIDTNQRRHGGDGHAQTYPLRPLQQLPRHKVTRDGACPTCGRQWGARRWTHPDRPTQSATATDRPASPPDERSSSLAESRSKEDP
ncbi:ferrochelatase [Salinibacter ruber]|uniref:ferrochelatase n=1 Tax=Salinibacter ruber TaxID=146919 RepID=UPI0021699957|nr:ferrochelatase [Salinibacter ruber]MCS3651774.1 ferrochelatase [Salinibacter ruber]MCS3654298.1 ferrochelatase [Salinibacter ruber]